MGGWSRGRRAGVNARARVEPWAQRIGHPREPTPEILHRLHPRNPTWHYERRHMEHNTIRGCPGSVASSAPPARCRPISLVLDNTATLLPPCSPVKLKSCTSNVSLASHNASFLQWTDSGEMGARGRPNVASTA